MTSWDLPRSLDFIESCTARLLTPPIRHFIYIWLADSNPSSLDYWVGHIFYMWLADSNPSSRDYWVGMELLDSYIYMKYSAFRRHFGYLAFSHWTQSFN
ncbi:hypothetical protein T12_16595 [Trichinella patagoniensis]|uniref:Uncharacterized protein n=1 Tax=Trichinella patagoniensis TaxID=990121 RepID=A0A0V0ZK17_9BILA|nr:hypothetical protein T12_16595 [Trichinella patagoniensis]